jgi:hypothetical protein
MNARQQSILVGAIIGAGLGALGGYLFARNMDGSRNEESLAVAARSVQAGDAIKLIIAVLGVLRGVSALLDAR